MGFDEGGAFFAAEGPQRAGDDEGLAREFSVAGGWFVGLHLDALCGEVFDFALVFGVGKESGDGLRADLAHVADGEDFVLPCLHEHGDGAEGAHEFAGGGTADAGDAEAGDEAGGVVLLAGLDGGEELVRVLFLADEAAFDEGVAMLLEVVDVGDVSEISLFDEGMDGGLAEAFDVHGVAADKVQEMVLKLRGAVRVLAADVGRIGLADGGRAADGARVADAVGLGACGALLQHDFLDFRDDFAGFVDADGVADADAETVDEVLVVERGALDARAAEADGVEDGRRRDAAGAADGELDGAQDGLFFFGRIFVGDGPAWDFARRAEFFAVSEAVELHDGAVDVVWQLPAALADGFDGCPDFVGGMADAVAMDGLDALRVHVVVGLGVRRKRAPLGRLEVEDEEREVALLRDAAVELAERAGRAVARVREGLEAEELLPLVDAVESGFFHVDFAADLEIWELVWKLLPDVVDDAGVRGDVLALHDAIAARDGAFELAVAVAQRHREAVDLFLDDEFGILERLLQFLDECIDFLFRKDVGEREHRDVVLHENAGRPHGAAADHLCRGVLRDEFGVLLFERFEAQHELVVFVVRNFGVVFIIIAVVVVADFLAELRQFALDFFDVLFHMAFSKSFRANSKFCPL